MYLVFLYTFILIYTLRYQLLSFLDGYFLTLIVTIVFLKLGLKCQYSQQVQQVQHCHQHREHQQGQQDQHDLSHQADHEIPKGRV